MVLGMGCSYGCAVAGKHVQGVNGCMDCLWCCIGRFRGSLHVGCRRNAWLLQQLPYVVFELNQH